jgi:hypothetical protein
MSTGLVWLKVGQWLALVNTVMNLRVPNAWISESLLPSQGGLCSVDFVN